MKYEDFAEKIAWGDTTAFVYDLPESRYLYSSGEINDGVFAYTNQNTEFRIDDIDNLPLVKDVIVDNFLSELKAAKGVEDDAYNYVRDMILSGNASIGSWVDFDGCIVYMLILC